MKTLKIEIPQGYEIDKEKSTFENIVFKLTKKELPKSWEELGNIKGYYTEINSVLSDGSGVTNIKNHNIFATKEQAEASIALAQLSQLLAVYNDGWVPDWSDNETKYHIRSLYDGVEVYECFVVQHFLSFKTKEIATQFLANFKDLILTAKPLL
jgi:fructose-1,6-bisphosphatase